jgi:Icc-related predicted phosphoesterase
VFINNTYINIKLVKTMKIKYMSDLHTEFGSNIVDLIGDVDGFDMLIIAGDVGASFNNIKALTQICAMIYPRKLAYVTGNHDFYYSSVDEVTSELAELEDIENFFFLNFMDMECIDERSKETIHIIGATGWQTREDYCFAKYFQMNDFRQIEEHDVNVRALGKLEYDFIMESLENNVGKKIVVVTHIPPTIKAIDPNSSESNKRGYIKAYYNDWDDIIEKYKPTLWICGHLHDSIDIMVGDTRLVRNAFGYFGDDRRQNYNFNNNLIIEV